MSIGIKVEVQDLEEISRKIQRIGAMPMHDILDAVGTRMVYQAKTRIRDTHAAPDGDMWPEWSARYAKSRKPQHDLLWNEGNLHDSLQQVVSGNTVLVGSNLDYAEVHQFGGPVEPNEWGISAVPPRPYLGVEPGTQDEKDLVKIIAAMVEDYIQ
jgi:phage virion morphogenesis protein